MTYKVQIIKFCIFICTFQGILQFWYYNSWERVGKIGFSVELGIRVCSSPSLRVGMRVVKPRKDDPPASNLTNSENSQIPKIFGRYTNNRNFNQ